MGKKRDKGGNGVIQCSDVISSVFYADHLFHFFIFINNNSYRLFHVLMSIKSSQMTLPSKVAYFFFVSKIEVHDITGNRPSS